MQTLLPESDEIATLTSVLSKDNAMIGLARRGCDQKLLSTYLCRYAIQRRLHPVKPGRYLHSETSKVGPTCNQAWDWLRAAIRRYSRIQRIQGRMQAAIRKEVAGIKKCFDGLGGLDTKQSLDQWQKQAERTLLLALESGRQSNLRDLCQALGHPTTMIELPLEAPVNLDSLRERLRKIQSFNREQIALIRDGEARAWVLMAAEHVLDKTGRVHGRELCSLLQTICLLAGATESWDEDKLSKLRLRAKTIYPSLYQLVVSRKSGN